MSDTFHDAQDLRRHRLRVRNQRYYQQAYRDRLKAARAPDRDDVAAATLRAFLKITVGDRNFMMMPANVVWELEAMGFDRAHAIERMQAMARRQRKGE